MQPKILLTATSRWFAHARLAMALREAGCQVEAICPSGHPLSQTRAVSRIYPFRALAPLRSIRLSLEAAHPDVVVPCDDDAVVHLHGLHSRAASGESTRVLLERSLGAASSFQVVSSRGRLMLTAQELGVRTASTTVIESRFELANWLAAHGTPAVLKSDGSYGGRGVRVVRSEGEAVDALRALSAPPSLRRAVKRSFVNRDTNYVLPCVKRTRQRISVQTFIPGQDANSTVVCWKGTVLANITVAVLQSSGEQGPASVVRVIENREISAAIEKIVGYLKLSGLIGFDFILDTRGDAYLIEMNPRSTQTGHLRLGAGRDLPGALYAAVTATPIQESQSVTSKQLIAYFPQEWLRDSSSEFLTTAFHDVPWDEPLLVRACINESPRRRIWDILSSRMSRPPFGRVEGDPTQGHVDRRALGATAELPGD